MFIPPYRNEVAYTLAKCIVSSVLNCVWIGEIPSCIAIIVANDNNYESKFSHSISKKKKKVSLEWPREPINLSKVHCHDPIKLNTNFSKNIDQLIKIGRKQNIS